MPRSIPLCCLAAAFLAVGCATALAQAPLPIYTDSLVNGFQDWGWTTHDYGNSSFVRSGSHSAAVTIDQQWGGLQIYHPDFDNSLYSSVSFWANGGPSGGQKLQIYGLLHIGTTNNAGTSGYSLPPLPTNAWQQFTIPLSAIGVANKSNFTGIVIQDRTGTVQPTYYLDDVQLVAAPAPALTHLSINATQAIRSVDARWFGLNTAMWDGYFDTPDTISLLQQMGTRSLRCMGGSASDEYHWATDKSLTNTWSWITSFANFLHVATNINAQVITTVNYGTGTSNEAAAWVAYANGYSTNTMSLGMDTRGTNWKTVGYWASLRAATPLGSDDGQNFLRIGRAAPLGFKYWEIGNECHGLWETDSNNVAHDPFTYANRARDYLQFMKAVDATIKVGMVVTPGESSYSNNANHFVVNPRTGTTNYGWTPVVFWRLNTLGVAPDFVIHHSYPSADCDPALLQSAGGVSGWAADAASLRQMLTDYLGAGSNVELCVTENNTSSQGKQLTSLVNGLYYADSLGQLMKTEFNSFIWWDLRNGPWYNGDLDPTIYGWRMYGDEGVIGDLNTCYPTFYAMKLVKYFAQPGDTVMSASSDYALVSAYAIRHLNGSLAVLVLNKDTTTAFNAEIKLVGYSPGSSATTISYGMPQDNAAQSGVGSQDLATNVMSGVSASFSNTCAPLSLTLFTFSPTSPQLAVLPPAPTPGGQISIQLQGLSGVPYVVQNSSNLASWISISTNTLIGATTNLSFPISSAEGQQFWRAVWRP